MDARILTIEGMDSWTPRKAPADNGMYILGASKVSNTTK